MDEARRRGAHTLAAISVGLLVLWLGAIPLSTGVAETSLVLAAVFAVGSRLRREGGGSWPLGWRSLVTGGPSTRHVPWLMLAFIAWYALSVPFGVDPATGAGKLHKLFRYALFFLPLAIPWNAKFWRAALWILIPLLFVVAWQGVASLAAGFGRARTPNMHYNTLAQVAGAISLLLGAGVLFGPPGSRRERGVMLLGAIAATAVLVTTFSRMAWVGWWTAAVVLVLVRLPRRIAVPITIAVVAIPAVMLPVLHMTRPQMFDLTSPEFTRRFDMWRMARNIVVDHPWTGIGPGGIDTVYDHYKVGVLVDDPRMWNHVHDDILEVAISHGLPATAIWIALIVSLYVLLARRLGSFRHAQGSWVKAAFAGCGACLHLFYVCGLLHDNYPIFVKACLYLFFWGQLVAIDRTLGSAGPRRAVSGEPA